MTDTGKPTVEVKEKKIHEPLLIMSKRASLSLGWSIGIRAIAIIAALLFCGTPIEWMSVAATVIQLAALVPTVIIYFLCMNKSNG